MEKKDATNNCYIPIEYELVMWLRVQFLDCSFSLIWKISTEERFIKETSIQNKYVKQIVEDIKHCIVIQNYPDWT